MKKHNKVIGIVVVISIILTFVLVLIYSINLDNTNPFHPNRTGKGRILYGNVMSMDKSINYPSTPEEVMGMQADILMLLYGDFIVDESLFNEVIMQQRLLFGVELLELNPFEKQYANFINYLSILQEENIRVITTEVKPIIYDPFNPNVGVARVAQNFNGLGRVNWVYYLERSSLYNKWKITGWVLADEHFSRIDL